MPVATALVIAACGSGATTAYRPVPPARPVEKSTCPEVVLTSDLQALDRKLVPYGQDLLGVETTFGAEGKRVRLISGGYLDDVFEAYDDMTEVGSMMIRDSQAQLLSSSLLGVPVRAAVWRESVDPPCDAHAIIAIGLSDEEFQEQVNALQ